MTRAQKATMILSSPRMKNVSDANAKRLKKMEQTSYCKKVFTEENSRMRIQSEYHKIDDDEYLPHKI